MQLFFFFLMEPIKNILMLEMLLFARVQVEWVLLGMTEALSPVQMTKKNPSHQIFREEQT